MRRLRFVFPVLLFTGACNVSSVVAPTTAAGEGPSTMVAADSTSATDAQAEVGTTRRDGGIVMGSGGAREASPITMGSGG
jgi:hypothetical protein